MVDVLPDFDLRILMFLQNLGTWLFPFMVFFSAIGNGVGAIVIAALFVWGGREEIGLKAGLVSSLAGAFNGILKISIRQPRPFWIDPRVQGLQFEGEFGMPSGHAMWSMAFWGYFAYAFRRMRYLFLSILMILLIGFSRVYLGVHSPTQVLAGWAAGGTVLILFLVLERPVARTVKKISTYSLISVIFIFSIMFVVAGTAIIGLSPEFSVPDLWTTNVLVFSDRTLAPVAMDSILMSTGIFFGMSSGAVLWTRRKTQPELQDNAPSEKSILKVILKRYLTGFLGIIPAAILYGASYLFLEHTPWLQESAFFILFSYAGAWITFGAPLAFMKFGLALRR